MPTQGCPLGAVLAEHKMGRALVRDLAEKTVAYSAAARSAHEALVDTLHRLTALYPSHIWREDYLLFPMAIHKIVSRDEQADLCQRFKAVDDAMGRDLLRPLEQLPAELQKH